MSPPLCDEPACCKEPEDWNDEYECKYVTVPSALRSDLNPFAEEFRPMAGNAPPIQGTSSPLYVNKEQTSVPDSPWENWKPLGDRIDSSASRNPSAWSLWPGWEASSSSTSSIGKRTRRRSRSAVLSSRGSGSTKWQVKDPSTMCWVPKHQGESVEKNVFCDPSVARDPVSPGSNIEDTTLMVWVPRKQGEPVKKNVTSDPNIARDPASTCAVIEELPATLNGDVPASSQVHECKTSRTGGRSKSRGPERGTWWSSIRNSPNPTAWWDTDPWHSWDWSSKANTSTASSKPVGAVYLQETRTQHGDHVDSNAWEWSSSWKSSVRSLSRRPHSLGPASTNADVAARSTNESRSRWGAQAGCYSWSATGPSAWDFRPNAPLSEKSPNVKEGPTRPVWRFDQETPLAVERWSPSIETCADQVTPYPVQQGDEETPCAVGRSPPPSRTNPEEVTNHPVRPGDQDQEAPSAVGRSPQLGEAGSRKSRTSYYPQVGPHSPEKEMEVVKTNSWRVIHETVAKQVAQSSVSCCSNLNVATLDTRSSEVSSARAGAVLRIRGFSRIVSPNRSSSSLAVATLRRWQ